MSEADCIFCRIVAGDLSSEIVASDEEFLAFRDIAPAADTHVLVIPRAHHANLDEWVDAAGGAGDTGGSSDRMLAFVRRTADDLGVAGRYRLVANVGADAGQVVHHLHWHILAGANLPGF